MTLRLLSYNIRHGGIGRERQIAEVVASSAADLVVLQEAVEPASVERIAAACGMKSWASVRGFSLGFMSRVDVARHTWHRVQFAKRRYLEIELAGSGTRIFGVHLAAIHSNLMERRREYELKSILAAVGKQAPGAHLLTGDFNTLAPGEDLDLRVLPPRLRMLAWITGGKIRWRTIQLMLDAGYVDGYRRFHKDEGWSFPVWSPHVRLDYVFLPAANASRLQSCEVVRTPPVVRDASDHFPLLFTLADAP